jgi:hypothetical protein
LGNSILKMSNLDQQKRVKRTGGGLGGRAKNVLFTFAGLIGTGTFMMKFDDAMKGNSKNNRRSTSGGNVVKESKNNNRHKSFSGIIKEQPVTLTKTYSMPSPPGPKDNLFEGCGKK